MTTAPNRASKAKKPKAVAKGNAPKVSRDAVPAVRVPDKNDAEILAQVALHPTLQAANTIRHYGKAMDGTCLDLEAMIGELTKHVAAVNGGDLERAEGMLIAQAHSLDAIFGNLARRAALNAGEYMGACETYLRLALKAQSQCRTTLETLATIKNPPNVAFVRQANMTTGPQQINNGAAAHPRAREIENLQSKLLEAQHGERLDFGTTGAPGKADPQMATVGKIEWAANSRRKRASIKKR